MKLFGYEFRKAEKPKSELNTQLWKIYEDWMNRYKVERHFADIVFMGELEKYIVKRDKELSQRLSKTDRQTEGKKNALESPNLPERKV